MQLFFLPLHACARRVRPWRLIAAAVVALLLGACGQAGRSAAAAIAVVANQTRCGRAWSAPHGGPLKFAVTNRFDLPMDVYLANARTGAVYQEVEGLGVNATEVVAASLADGTYRFQCYPSEEPSVLGPKVRITQARDVRDPTPGVVPVTVQDLIAPTKRYQAWVTSRLPVLLSQAKALAAAVRGGATPAAKADWLTAHLTYERLGAAYNAFGALDGAINGFPPGNESWRRGKGLTGFHEIEGLLWSGAPAARLEPAARTLVGDIRKLIVQFRTAEIDVNVNTIALRAHEIVENAIQFELTGQTDAGSHTNLATISANLFGSWKALSYLKGLLRSRYPQLKQTEAALAASRKLVASYDRRGSWAPLNSLSRYQRERLDASLEQLVQLLAPVAAIGDPRQVPTL